MFKIRIEKENGEEIKNMEVTNKQAFLSAVSVLFDTLQCEVFEKGISEMALEKAEERVFGKIDAKTGYVFDNQDEFFKWLNTMKDYNLVTPDFNWDKYRKDIVNDWVIENTDYDSWDEMNDTFESIKSDMDDIYDIARQW